MESTTYYFTSSKNEKDLNNMISDPLFKKIVAYLSEHKSQEVILRQIKANIETDKNLELYLDKLIKYGLVERKNRRYSLRFPIYSAKKDIPISETIIDPLKNMIQDNPSQISYFIFGEWLWSFFFEEEHDHYFFGVESSPSSLPLFCKREEGNDSLRFVSIYQAKSIPLDLANYFSLLSKRQKLPEQFKPLEHLIGDVDINYFILQIQKVIRSSMRHTKRVRKQTIFEAALLETKDLSKNTEGELSLITTCLDDSQLSEEIQATLAKLKMELVSLWAPFKVGNQREFFKMQLFSVLFTTCFQDKSNIRYFKFS